jgi:hypothetical protein
LLATSPLGYGAGRVGKNGCKLSGIGKRRELLKPFHLCTEENSNSHDK